MKKPASFLAVIALLILAPRIASAEEPAKVPVMQKVLGIGGLFFRSENPKVLAKWYEDNLGISPVPTSYGQKTWLQEAGPTAFAPLGKNTKYFGKQTQGWMVDFRVADLKAMVAQLKASGITVEEPQSYPNGDFARLYDPEGNPIEPGSPKNRKSPSKQQRCCRSRPAARVPIRWPSIPGCDGPGLPPQRS